MKDEPETLTASDMRALGLYAYMEAQKRPVSVEEMKAVMRVLAEEYPDDVKDPVLS